MVTPLAPYKITQKDINLWAISQTKQPVQQKVQAPVKSSKLSFVDFAQRIKTKYPEYKDLADLDLTERMIQVYPQYKDQVELPERFRGAEILAGISRAWAGFVPKTVWGIAKFIWKQWVAPWMNIQTPQTEAITKFGEKATEAGQQAEDFVRKWYSELWVQQNTAFRKGWQLWTNIALSVAWWPKWPSFPWFSAGAKHLAKYVAWRWLIGASEEMRYNLGTEWQVLSDKRPYDMAIWTTAEVVVPMLPSIAKWLYKWAKELPSMIKWSQQTVSEIPWAIWTWLKGVKNKVAEWLTSSYLKNPAMREKYMSKVWQAPEVTLLEAGIKWSLPDQVKQISKLSSDSRNQARQSAQNIQETIYSPEWSWITKKMIEWVDTTIPWIDKKMQPILEMSKRFEEWKATAQDLIDAKTFLSRYESIYDDFGRVKKTGDLYEKEALADMYTVMKNQLEDLWTKYGVDFKEINRNTMKYEWLRDIATRAASREAGRDVLSLTDYIMWWYGITADPVTWMWALITKKALESPYIWSNVANFLYTKSKNALSPLSSSNVPSGNILSMAWQKWLKATQQALPAPKATVIPLEWLPQVKQPIAPVPRTRQVLETWMENVKQPTTVQPWKSLPTKTEAPLAQSTTKETQKLPVAKKTPLVKATDSKNISPKVKKPLIKSQVVSKVDDALLTAWKMEEKYIPWQDISDFTYDRYKKAVLSELPSADERDIKRMYQTLVDDGTIKSTELPQKAKSLESDLTSSIKKAKAEGKTFEDYISWLEKDGKIIYHWTNQVFDKFNDSVLKAKGGQWYSSELWHWFTDSSDEAVEYAKQANKRLMRNQLDFDKKSQDLVDKITLAERQRKFDLAEELTEQLEQLEKTAREPWEDIVIKAILPDNLLKHKVKNNVRLMEEQMEVAKKAKAEWYKGVIFEWVSDSPLWAVRESNQTVIFNPKDIKTTSQLRTERDKLDQPTTSAIWKTTTELPQKAKSLESDLTSSIKKAKAEGKTFEDYISWLEKDKKVLYHWTSVEIKKAIEENWFSNKIGNDVKHGDAVYLTDNYDDANSFGFERMTMRWDRKPTDVVKVYAPEQRIYKYDWEPTATEIAELKNKWYDWVSFVAEDTYDADGFLSQPWRSEIVVRNKGIVKTKKQLRTERDKLDQPTTSAIWKPINSDLATEAKKTPLVKATELPMKVDEWLVTEARKYKSADEFVDSLPVWWKEWRKLWRWEWYYLATRNKPLSTNNEEISKRFWWVLPNEVKLYRWVKWSNITYWVVPWDYLTTNKSYANNFWELQEYTINTNDLSFWKWNNDYIYIWWVDKTESRLRKIREEANQPTTPALWKTTTELPQKAKSLDTPVKKELSDKGGVLTVKPNNQLKFNQWDSYEPVRLVVNDKDAMVARYWALRNKDMQSLWWKAKLTNNEKMEMQDILRKLEIDDATATKRHQFLKNEAKKVRSSSEQVLHEISDDFRKAKSLEPSDLTKEAKKYKSAEEFVSWSRPSSKNVKVDSVETTPKFSFVRLKWWKNYKEIIHSVDFETNPWWQHYSKYEYPNYFAHSRIDEVSDSTRVLEIQSDLMQSWKYLDRSDTPIRLSELSNEVVNANGTNYRIRGIEKKWNDYLIDIIKDDWVSEGKIIELSKLKQEIKKPIEDIINTTEEWFSKSVQWKLKKQEEDRYEKIVRKTIVDADTKYVDFPTWETASKIQQYKTIWNKEKSVMSFYDDKIWKYLNSLWAEKYTDIDGNSRYRIKDKSQLSKIREQKK